MDRSKRKATHALSGAAIAAAAAGLLLAQASLPVAAADAAKVQCTGVNACKGKSECHTEKNDCKGQNACKGQGVIETTAKECEAKGGKVQKS